MDNNYYQRPETLELSGSEPPPYSIEKKVCDCCENHEGIMKYGGFHFCRACYAKVEPFLFSKFSYKLFEVFGQEQAFAMILELYELIAERYTDLETNDVKNGIIKLEKWIYIEELNEVLEQLFDQKLIAYKKLPSGDYWNEYFFIKLNLNYGNI